MANVFSSCAGAKAVMGSNMVLEDLCSEVDGSKVMTLPFALPSWRQWSVSHSGQWVVLPKATQPPLIHAATRISSYAAKRAISPPV